MRGPTVAIGIRGIDPHDAQTRAWWQVGHVNEALGSRTTETLLELQKVLGTPLH